jgi:hypothetical protein
VVLGSLRPGCAMTLSGRRWFRFSGVTLRDRSETLAPMRLGCSIFLGAPTVFIPYVINGIITYREVRQGSCD